MIGNLPGIRQGVDAPRQFKRFEKDGRGWYSHRQGDTWCKEK
jgi:hypothetical protein